MRTSNVVNRARPEAVRTTDDARAHAEADLKDGFAFLCAAFNLSDNAELRYAWDEATRKQAFELCARLLLCFRSGTIAVRAGAIAQDDKTFQRFLAEIANRPIAT